MVVLGDRLAGAGAQAGGAEGQANGSSGKPVVEGRYAWWRLTLLNIN